MDGVRAQLYQSADGLTTYDWNPSSSGESYPQARTSVVAAIAALVAAGYTPTIKAVWWMQGETDATDATMGLSTRRTSAV